jgi:murein DD-endopeptidase MepM/ murein hydrolase activator NlpD
LDQARLRAASRKHAAEPIELGSEPPLSVDGGTGGLIHRRRVSIQWFSGTILTGLCGAALMGGAVFASLDGETTFAKAPERVEAALRGAPSNSSARLTGNLRKTDRLPVLGEPNVERLALRVPTVSHRQDREMVRVRPYERVFGNLSLTVSDLSANIPPFNPQKILADAVSGDDQSAAPQPDAEVSFSTCEFVPPPHRKDSQAVCELSSLLPKVKRSSQLPLDEVLERVRDLARASGTRVLADATGAPPMHLGYASDNDSSPYLGFEARIVPENLTLLPKTQPNAAPDANERVITAKRGETVGMILHDLGTTPDLIQQILAVLGPAVSDYPLKEGQHVRVLLAPPLLGRVLPERVVVDGDSSIEAAAALSDMNTYVPVDIRNIDAESNEQPPPQDTADIGASLYQSLWETALQNNVPRPVIEELVRIYAYDVDFQRKVEPGDSFDVLYSQDVNGDGTHEIRYASLRVGGETQTFYHFRTSDNGQYDYYDATGKSAKKFLVRKPVTAGMESSPFGWRINPLLHIKEMHTGVDWAAPLGTPIFAAGDGTIEQIGDRGGYGKYIRIRHADGYETAYGHMIAFARGLDVESHVRQGQVIGFVGSTGLSTGAHVHFEIWVNGRVVDPMRIKLPRGRVLEGPTLAEFERDRNQLDALMANDTMARVAQMR